MLEIALKLHHSAAMRPLFLTVVCLSGLALNSIPTKADDEVNWERQILLKAPTNGADINGLEHRARFGDVVAQTRLGQIYYNGEGVPVDFIKGFFWMQQAASSGGLIAQEQIACAFLTGSGADRNESVSHFVSLKLANEGMPEAQHIVAIDFYILGLREKESYFMGYQPETMLQTNLVQAYKWVELARLNGFPVSKERNDVLEEINKTSINYAQKLVAAFKPKPTTPLRITTNGFVVQPIPWLTFQASNDLAYAQFNLGMRFFQGDGLATNQINAFYWIEKSASRGYPPAVVFLKTNSPPQK